MMNTKGLTVVELLIAAAIFLVLLILISSGLQNGGQVVDRVMTESEVIEDLRAAGQIMTDTLSRAVYIYPPGSEISLNKAVSWSVRNPISKKNTWTLGKDPIIALIQAADNPLLKAEDCPTKEDACLRFIAYYVLERQNVVSADARFSPFLEDPQNKDSWMLFEYRKVLSTGKLDLNTPPPRSWDEGLIDGRAYLIADYLKLGTGFIPFASVACRNEEAFDPECNDLSIMPGLPLKHLETVVLGEFQLEAEHKRRGNVIRSPVLSFAIAPKNLYSK